MKLTPITISTVVLVLTAYDGDGDVPPQLATQQLQTISGVAAAGAALPSVTVNVTCPAGSGTATTRTDSNYSTPITDTSLPYMVTAVSSDSKTVLHSLVVGSGSIGGTATISITPPTELLLV